jgi:hypothetical protein
MGISLHNGGRWRIAEVKLVGSLENGERRCLPIADQPHFYADLWQTLRKTIDFGDDLPSVLGASGTFTDVILPHIMTEIGLPRHVNNTTDGSVRVRKHAKA